MSDKKVKAVLVELTQNDIRKMVNGEEVVQKGETRKYWYQAEGYPSEVLDNGKYWDVCGVSCLCPATPGGVTVVDDLSTIGDWLELSDMSIAREALELEPGQWVEREYSDWYSTGCRVRATAYAELPPLSAEQTIKMSDLSHKAMTRIKVNGKTLYAPGTMESGVQAWFPDLFGFVSAAIVLAVRAKGGPTAEVALHGNRIEAQKDKTLLAFDLKAKSREGLVEFLRNLGVANPETVKVTKTVGDANGVTCVYTLFTGADWVNS